MICSFQLRCWSIWIPKYFTLVLISIFWPLIQKLRCLVICFLFRLSITSSVLSAFKLILLDFNHWTIRERSWLMSLFICFIDLLMCRQWWRYQWPFSFFSPIEEENFDWNLHLNSVKPKLNKAIGLFRKIRYYVPKFLLKVLLYYTISFSTPILHMHVKFWV